MGLRAMGLREDKKKRQRREILAAGIRRFRSTGFERTRVSDIIAELEISEATFFNYFPSKDCLLSDWVHEVLDEAWQAGGAGSGDRAARQQIRRAVGALAERIDADRTFMAEAWRRARVVRAFGARRGDTESRTALLQIVEGGQRREELRADLSADRIAGLLDALILAEVGSWLAGPGDTALGSRLNAGVGVLLDGCRKRLERVARPQVRPVGPT